MSKEQPAYLSYLLRLWRENDDTDIHRAGERVFWRASLENSLTGKRQGFSSLNDLFAFLQRETGVMLDCDVQSLNEDA
jgi:hypothetical protein